MIRDLPWMTNAAGDTRRVGVEIEMRGLSLETLARTTAGVFGLAIEHDGRYQYRLTGDPAGDWRVEVDFRLLKEMGQVDYRSGDLGDEVRQTLESLLQRVSEPFVPLELIGPPLPLTRLDDFGALSQALRDAGATGSSDQWLNAFALQFNPEVPASDAATLRRYLQAFLCLADWLLWRADIDLARRVTNYIDPFPRAYVRQLMEGGYQPDLDGLIGDYLARNPTRNRALDLMPLFSHLAPEQVRAVTEDPLIKPRPALHYRLPNSEIHRPGWTPGPAWDDWCQVEFLAADPVRLAACCSAYRRALASPLERWLGDWLKEVETQWLHRP